MTPDLEFFTPEPNDGTALGGLCDHTVGSIIPTYGFNNRGVGGMHMYVWDRQDDRIVELVAPYTLGNSGSSKRLIQTFVTTLQRHDPAAIEV